MDDSSLLDWLYSTQLFGYKLGLENPKKLIHALDAFPQGKTQVIHVAGTNGKGSTCAMIESLARAKGLKTGLFTSPHLLDFRERIRVQGEMIGSHDLEKGLQKLKDLVSDWEVHPTFFELTLALALEYFSHQELDLLILETGLGGRLDATNALPKNVAVLTPIGLDHTQWLGESLKEIALEKAGIIQSETPVVSAIQEPEALEVIQEQALRLNAPLTLVTESLSSYPLALKGPHQQQNAALALTALQALGYEFSPETLADGLAQTQWEGRFEQIHPFLIVDGAHNTHASPRLKETWQVEYGSAQTTLLFGAVNDKDVSGVLQDLLPLAHTLFLVPLSSPRALRTEEIAKLLPKETSLQVRSFHSLPEALVEAIKQQEASSALGEPPLPALLAGSLYLVGETKAIFAQQEWRPSTQ